MPKLLFNKQERALLAEILDFVLVTTAFNKKYDEIVQIRNRLSTIPAYQPIHKRVKKTKWAKYPRSLKHC